MSPIGYIQMIIRTANDLASLIRDRRLKKAMTQAELATAVGVSRKWIVGLEGGKRAADLSLVLRTLKALNLELDVKERRDSERNPLHDLDRIIEAHRRTVE